MLWAEVHARALRASKGRRENSVLNHTGFMRVKRYIALRKRTLSAQSGMF